MTRDHCVFAGCPEAAAGDPLPVTVRVDSSEVDVELRLCSPHREFLLRGTLDALSLPPPARPA